MLLHLMRRMSPVRMSFVVHVSLRIVTLREPGFNFLTVTSHFRRFMTSRVRFGSFILSRLALVTLFRFSVSHLSVNLRDFIVFSCFDMFCNSLRNNNNSFVMEWNNVVGDNIYVMRNNMRGDV